MAAIWSDTKEPKNIQQVTHVGLAQNQDFRPFIDLYITLFTVGFLLLKTLQSQIHAPVMSEFHACSLGLGAILGLVDTSS
jgi:hypothetical protein